MDRPVLDEDAMWLIVTQALKSTKQIPIEKLVQLFDTYHTEPNWEEMLLPQGRNVRECREWFDSNRRYPAQHQSQQHSPFPRQETPSNSNKRKSGPDSESVVGELGSKRRSGTGVEGKSSAQHTNIAPKPPSNSASPIGTTFPPPSAVPPAKRRGRPPKALVEERQRQQIERGEVIAPMPIGAILGPIRHSPQRESYSNVPGFTTIAPRSPAPAPLGSPRRGGNMQDVPSQRRRGSPKISKREPPLRPGEYTFNVNPQPGGREEYTPPVPRESMAGPIAPATSISQITHPVDPPKQTPAEPSPPKPGLDPQSSKS